MSKTTAVAVVVAAVVVGGALVIAALIVTGGSEPAVTSPSMTLPRATTSVAPSTTAVPPPSTSTTTSTTSTTTTALVWTYDECRDLYGAASIGPDTSAAESKLFALYDEHDGLPPPDSEWWARYQRTWDEFFAADDLYREAARALITVCGDHYSPPLLNYLENKINEPDVYIEAMRDSCRNMGEIGEVALDC